MSEFSGSYYVVRGVPFAVVLVRPQSFSSEKHMQELASAFSKFFPQVPIVLAAEGSNGYRLWGQGDLVDYLSRSGPIQWKTYSTD